MTLTQHAVARELAGAFVEGTWDGPGLVGRGSMALGCRPAWLDRMVTRLLAAFPGPRPTARRVAGWIDEDQGFRGAWDNGPVAVSGAVRPPPAMSPAPGPPATWPVPAIATRDDLAARLGLAPPELDWFADLQGRLRDRDGGALPHYDYRWAAKRDGSARLVEVPRPRLRLIQRRLLRDVVGRVPPHDAAHGFRTGRSVRSFVAPHAGRAVVIRLDLRDFFPTVTRARVASLFRTAGYPEAVAATLAGLCTNRVPGSLWARPDAPAALAGPSPEAWRARRRLAEPHLPQGAPTSPALANLAAWRLDRRLAALAEAAGAAYTRYADDLAFSGGPDLARAAGGFVARCHAIAIEEGFLVHPRKTRIMRPGNRQALAGVVLNDRPNIARSDYDDLKATLHNCARFGPAGQDRAGRADFRAHLIGRIAHVATLNPARADRLRARFDQIAW